MAIEIFDDEYQVGWLCKAWLPAYYDWRVPCRRPRGHEGAHQNKGKGWKWWDYPPADGGIRGVRLP